MEMNLKATKTPTGMVWHDANTSDPIAITEKTGSIKNSFSKPYSTVWHPTFLKMNPSVESTIMHRNLDAHRSPADVKEQLTEKYKSIMETDRVRDPVDMKFSHIENADLYGHGDHSQYHVYKLSDHSGNLIGHGHVLSENVPSLGTKKDYQNVFSKLTLDKNFSDSIPESVKIAAERKFPIDTRKRTVPNQLAYLRHLVDNKNKLPRFVGHAESSYSPDGSTSIFKTHLSPSEASQAYYDILAEKLKSHHYPHTLQRHSDTVFTAHSNGGGGREILHTVVAMPGKLIHTVGEASRENKTIIEEKQ